MPARRNGSTNQFGMRRLRRSVKVATARTMSVGHQANECMPHDPFPLDTREITVKAIDQPNRQTTNSSYFSHLTMHSWKSVHRCLRAAAGVKRRVYNRP